MRLGIFIQFGHQPLTLFVAQPGRLLWRIRQVFEDHAEQQHARDPFNQEEPLPAFEAQRAIQLQQRRRDRSTNGQRDRDGEHENRDDACAVTHREPVGEVQNDRREEARFSHTQQEAHDQEAFWALNQCHAGGDQPPSEEDAGNPAARTDFRHEQVAGYFEQAVTDEEQTRAPAINGSAQANVSVHRQGGKAHVDPIQIGNDVQADQ